MKNVIALSLYIGTNVLVYERRLMVKFWSMTKFCVKRTFSAKIAIFSSKMTQLKIFLCLTQALKELQRRLLEKQFMTKFLKF